MSPFRFKWPGLASTREDHPEPPPVFRLPPSPQWPAWNSQHGVHDPAFDPTGSGPVRLGSGEEPEGVRA